MKKPNKFIQFCFLINSLQAVLFIGLFIGIIPTVAISRQAGNVLFDILGSETFRYIFNGLTLLSFINWIFCVRFWYKNDKYSKAIFPLLFPNVIYSPFYYYQVIIKTRPLRNKINVSENKTNNVNTISENDFEKITRDSIIEILELWSSKKEQLEFQESQPGTNVTEELFEQWNNLFLIDSEEIKESFSTQEFGSLVQFDTLIHNNYEKRNGNFMKLTDFVDSVEWKELNLCAIKTLTELNKN